MKESNIEICKATLNSFLTIENSIFEEIMKKMELKTIEARKHILTNRDVCNEIGIICSGIARVYEVIEDKENTVYFNFQPKNPIVSDYSSFISGQVSRLNIEAINQCEILFIKKSDLLGLFNNFHMVERLGRILAERHYIDAMERITSFQTKDATKRYIDLKKSYPDIDRHVPDRITASYLGITKESFSRIKKKLLHL